MPVLGFSEQDCLIYQRSAIYTWFYHRRQVLYIIDRSTYTAVIAGLVFKGEERPKSTVGLGYCSNHAHLKALP